MFVKTVRKSTITTFLLLIVSIVAAWLLLAWPRAAASGISRGLAICSSIIIPSLFPFLVLAGFIVKSGLSVSIGRRLERPTRFLFGLPGCCAAGILIGFIGGYPAGGIAVGELVRQGSITRRQGRRMLSFCVNGGPAFIISAVGVGMLGSLKYGVMLYAAHIAASLLLGIFLRFEATPEDKKPVKNKDKESTADVRKLSPASAFVESVGGACKSMLVMCGFIVLFASILSLADGTGFATFFENKTAVILGSSKSAAPLLSCILPCLLEVSCGSVEAAHAGTLAPLMLGLTLGWGGLSVHCQISATLQDLHLVNWRFFAARLLHALLGSLITVLLFHYVPVAAMAFHTFSDKTVIPYSYSYSASAALLFLCALFLLTLTNRKDKAVENSTGKKEANML